MKARMALMVVALVAMAGASAGAQQEVTPEDYDAAMKSVRATVGGVNEHLEAQNAPELGADGAKFVEAFEKVNAYWTARDETEAMNLATIALSAARRFQEAGGAGNFDVAGEAFSEMRGTCMTCHTQYRERDADGNWQIKGGSGR